MFRNVSSTVDLQDTAPGVLLCLEFQSILLFFSFFVAFLYEEALEVHINLRNSSVCVF